MTKVRFIEYVLKSMDHSLNESAVVLLWSNISHHWWETPTSLNWINWKSNLNHELHWTAPVWDWLIEFDSDRAGHKFINDNFLRDWIISPISNKGTFSLKYCLHKFFYHTKKGLKSPLKHWHVIHSFPSKKEEKKGLSQNLNWWSWMKWRPLFKLW